MNQQISRVAIVALLLLASLIVATTYWQTWAAPGLAARQDNAIQRVAQFEIKRGLIYAADGKTVLAKNVAQEVRRPDALLPHLPDARLRVAGDRLLDAGPLARRARALGERVPDGLEREPRHDLRQARPTSSRARRSRGNNLVLNLSVGAQKLARDRCSRGKCGAAVVLNPKTGAVYVMASSPTYDPNQIESPSGYASIIHAPSRVPGLVGARCSTARRRASTRRARRSRRSPPPPRSTPASTRPTRRSSTPATAGVRQEGLQRRQPRPERARAATATSTLVQAFEHSINAVFCNIGKTLGAEARPRRGEEVRLLLEAADRAAVERGRRRAASTTSRRTRLYDNAGHRSTRAASPSARSTCS